ncbi:3-oxoacyl-[acyl-carrier-protein] reductase [Pyricularia oryzae 70-15]|uniref:3-oxoacyl-[acyl-carrier-protein] reductase n=3 Tax=Pyricularia oryzae TaxID=318829 RepID=G4MZU0_PYRO7|nr:3-oxoacyl-[acyl-carrier-protein] reductase [Pyricularia oryzae 70-15]EHA51384.1 3-oxoacyl-[acyl-carrier-protein] reductase [Pyricularia oryzae 70-15]ELQ44859.1 3-oxoacyl-[acyl-carrier-protein] reductase [Pyricularia oryzae Y34]
MATHYGINTTGRVYSITGGASGIGLRKEVKEINQDTEVYLEDVDVGDNAQVQDWVQRIIKTSGALHGSANVAGIPQKAYTGGRPAILIESDQEWERILRVNLDGVKYCTRAQVEAMLSMDKGSHPAIVNVTSRWHSRTMLAPMPTKSAKPHASISPRPLPTTSARSTLTPMTKVFFGDIPEGKFEETMEAYGLPPTPLQPEDVARVIVWLLSENSLDVNGNGLPVGGSEP